MINGPVPDDSIIGGEVGVGKGMDSGVECCVGYVEYDGLMLEGISSDGLLLDSSFVLHDFLFPSRYSILIHRPVQLTTRPNLDD